MRSVRAKSITQVKRSIQGEYITCGKYGRHNHGGTHHKHYLPNRIELFHNVKSFVWGLSRPQDASSATDRTRKNHSRPGPPKHHFPSMANSYGHPFDGKPLHLYALVERCVRGDKPMIRRLRHRISGLSENRLQVSASFCPSLLSPPA